MSGPRPGELLRALARARRTVALYGRDHPVSVQTLAEVHQRIQVVLSARAIVRLFVHDDTFFLENTVLLEESLQLYGLLTDMTEREIDTIELREGVEMTEIARLVEVLNLGAAELKQAGGPAAYLERHGVRYIAAGRFQGQGGYPRLERRVDSRDAFRAGLRAVDELNFQASRNLPLALRKARLVVTSFIDLAMRDRATLMAMTALRNHDEETCHHSVNVSILSLLTGLTFEFDRGFLTTVGLAALLHDVGKMRVPREILIKPGTLSPHEQETVRRHTLYGAQILQRFTDQIRLAAVAAFEHHANYDLSGYPQITMRRVPHLLSRLIQVADFYDAATSLRRAYRRPMLPPEAMRFILDQAGRLFDPVLARAFVRALGPYPAGSTVELSSGEIAVVVRPGERMVTRPIVTVVRGPRHDSVEARMLPLEGRADLSILRALDPADIGIDVSDHLYH